ncbi:MAG TPA: VCBS repeat-containing protein [Candidatus Poseidoniales archaeon]|nr:VCBS repeat-containing protein [Candidatus Poseidoniales archaeon]
MRTILAMLIVVSSVASGCLGGEDTEVLPSSALLRFDSDLLSVDAPTPIVVANLMPASIDDESVLLITEPLSGEVLVTRCSDQSCTTEIISGLGSPVRTAIADMDGDGEDEIVVADIGVLYPVDDAAGRVLILEHGTSGWNVSSVISMGARTVCAEPGDLDGDGDIDLSVCVFGHTRGRLIWVEQTSSGWTEHILDDHPGTIHAHLTDIDADGDLDILAALSQEQQIIQLWRNDGQGNFTSEDVVRADNSWYGLSGIQLVDIEGDGDVDILATNGDNLDDDLPISIDPGSIHGLSLYLNDGQGVFTSQRLIEHWGAYGTATLDVDGDCDLDIVLTALQHETPYHDNRMVEREPIVLLLNEGSDFVKATVDGRTELPLTVAAADLDGDGSLEVYTASHNALDEQMDDQHRLARYTPKAQSQC